VTFYVPSEANKVVYSLAADVGTAEGLEVGDVFGGGGGGGGRGIID
jgi:hypothetical protein